MAADKIGFTFWENFKATIDAYRDPIYKYKLYDALTEYGLYGVWPEDDGTEESERLISFIQSLSLSLDKSRGYNQKVVENGSIGGRAKSIEDEQIIEAIKSAAIKKKGIPTRQEVVDEIEVLFGIKVSVKLISRRIPDEEKRTYALIAVREQNEDKTCVPGDIEGHKGQNGDIEGQNRDSSFVSGDIRNVPGIPGGFDF